MGGWGVWRRIARVRETGKSNNFVGEGEGELTVRLPDLQDGVAPSEGELMFRVRVENSLAIIVEHGYVLVGVVKFLALLPLMDGRVGCHRVV